MSGGASIGPRAGEWRPSRRAWSAWLGGLGGLVLGAQASGVDGVGAEAEGLEGSAAPVTRKVQAEYQGLLSSDVQLISSSVIYREERHWGTWNVGIAYNHNGFDYVPAPFDFLGEARSVGENRIGGTIGAGWRLGSELTLSVSGGLYDGFNEYRSAWLHEYYRQQFATLPGFVEASPSGWQSGVGLRWEYLPTTGFLQADFGYQRDEIAPGYEIDFDGLRRGRDTLTTPNFRLSAENVLGRRLRTLLEFRIVDTTDRDPRFGWQGSVNYAPWEGWIVRGFAGYTREGSDSVFEAHYVGVSVEYEPVDGWQFGLSGRYYRDSGEIENSLFSSSAPGIEAWQVGLSARHAWGIHAVRLLVAPYLTRYEPFGIGTAFFQNLYRSRDWALVQAAYTVEF